MTKMEIRTNIKDTVAQWITESIGDTIHLRRPYGQGR